MLKLYDNVSHPSMQSCSASKTGPSGLMTKKKTTTFKQLFPCIFTNRPKYRVYKTFPSLTFESPVMAVPIFCLLVVFGRHCVHAFVNVIVCIIWS